MPQGLEMDDARRYQESPQAGHPPEAPPRDRMVRLQHHFDSATQQFEAAKLGMWLFLATEMLLFGGLFCFYAVYRGNHPEVFAYGSRFLDTTWGAINTTVLILSSVTMALAVWCAQCDHRRGLILFLGLTLVFAGDFLVIKYIEYSHKIHEHLVWGMTFYEPPPGLALTEAAVELPEPAGPDPATGRTLWTATCRACHGVAGEGIAGQGKDIRGSEFIAGLSDEELLGFITVGRMPFDPLNTTGIQMPPRGGNPLLDDEDLANIVAFIRTFEGFGADSTAETLAAPVQDPVEEGFWIPRSTIPLAGAGPAGVDRAFLDGPGDGSTTLDKPHHTRDPARPANAHVFFGIYFMMTGLHGLHVLAGAVLITWLLVRARRGHFSSEYFTPVDLGGLYWHVVDIIWIFLFPLFYLI